MVRKWLPALAGFVFVVNTWADEFDAPRKRPVIKQVVIEENAAWSDERSSSDEPRESCADFVLKESDIREFFKVARFASSREYSHDLLVSRCYASGRITLENGQEAEWQIDRARLGILIFKDKHYLYFFCAECTSKAYGEACDIDCIHAP